jgi:hypothetical protein
MRQFGHRHDLLDVLEWKSGSFARKIKYKYYTLGVQRQISPNLASTMSLLSPQCVA